MTSSEDKIVQSRIQDVKESQELEKEHNPDADDAFAYPEAHYNHYGTRGYVDAYFGVGNWSATVLEVKSASAVNESTGANEILRQYNKMQEAFFKGTDYTPPSKSLQYELCFTASPQNIGHVVDNKDLYRSAASQLQDHRTERVMNIITIRFSESNSPLILFRYSTRSSDVTTYETIYNREDVLDYKEGIRRAHSEIWNQLEPYFDES